LCACVSSFFFIYTQFTAPGAPGGAAGARRVPPAPPPPPTAVCRVSTAKALLVPDAEVRAVDWMSAPEAVRFCRVASANEPTAYLAWHDSLGVVGEHAPVAAWRCRWIGWLTHLPAS
jgi:hypothetical protein